MSLLGCIVFSFINAHLECIYLLQEHLIWNNSLSSTFISDRIYKWYSKYVKLSSFSDWRLKILNKTEHENFDLLTICSGDVISLGPW